MGAAAAVTAPCHLGKASWVLASPLQLADAHFPYADRGSLLFTSQSRPASPLRVMKRPTCVRPIC